MTIDKFDKEYRFLSNFYFCNIPYKGIEYPSVEHAYQASKTNNDEHKIHISKLPTAYLAKRVGNQTVIRNDWDDIKLNVMEDLLLLKFKYKALRMLLLMTGNQKLIEGNNWNDKFWGVCDGEGENNLGKLLMKIREFYRSLPQ